MPFLPKLSELKVSLNRSSNSSRRKSQINKKIFYDTLEPRQLLAALPVINEFLASNSSGLLDDNGNSTDWIEIYNAGDQALNLVGYSLTDDPGNTSKYIFPNKTLAAGQYLVVFAGDDTDPVTGAGLFTGFSLRAAGEYVGLYDTTGALVSEFSAGGTNYPAQYADVSYGLIADGAFSHPGYFSTPTPNAINGASFLGFVADTTVSVERGFYEAAFSVVITSPTPGATLVYTTDGTGPSLINGSQVLPANSNSSAQTSLVISTTKSLRTAAFKPGFVTLGATTNTYVFLDQVITSNVMNTGITQDPRYASSMRDALLDIPTLSFNYKNVIVNSDVPEQIASIEWLAPDGSDGFQIDAGIKGFGGYFTNFAKKNFRLNFRSEYGDSRLDFPLFEGFDNSIPATDSFDSLDFRSGSHDMVARGFYMSNRFVDDTLMDLGHAVPHGRFVHIYTNGVYWGQYHMRERWNADFLAQYYGGDKDDYEAINGNVNNGNNTPGGWSPGEVYDGDGTAWNNINSMIANYQGNPGDYEALSQVVNMAEYIDYMLLYMSGNSENEYRSGGSADGSVPYTFTLNDADGWLRSTGNRVGDPGPANIFGKLVAERDPEFMILYADRIQNMFFNDGALTEDQAVARLQERLDEIQLSFLAESARWGYRSPSSWETAANTAKNNMLPAISGIMIANLRAAGVFPSINAPVYKVNGITQSGGSVSAGASLAFDANDTVYYTVDGSDPRLVGGGINPNAIRYDSGANSTTLFGSGSSWKYHDLGANLGTAWQSSNYNDASWSSGASELGYGDGDENTVVGFGPNANNKYITTYFRKTFNVPAGEISAATLRIKRDDGAVVYLNGALIVRSNMPAGTINFNTTASSAIGGSDESTWLEFSIPTSLIQAGNNTLAVEIHQSSVTSSDITFDAEFVVFAQSSQGQPYILNTSTRVQSRTLSSGTWSAVHDAIFALPATQSDLRISEIHFNPADPTSAEMAAGFVDNNDFEFIELYNPHPIGTINLDSMTFSNGVSFGFGNVDLLPGERVVVVKNVSAFRARYGSTAKVLGEWTGSLSNSGEKVTLIDSALAEVMSVSYGDNDPWYIATDGHGFSLVLVDPSNTPAAELGKYYSWRASTELGGTPGTGSAAPRGVVINEVLANANASLSDSIELFNPTGAAINIGGWYLSDSGNNPFKFQIPGGTVLGSGQYIVFNESDFNPTPGTPLANHFGLNGASGDEVFLTRSVGGSTVVLEDAVNFGGTFNGESLGRIPNGSGRLNRMASRSFGTANGIAKVGPLVISEVNYNPAEPTQAAINQFPTLTSTDLEFIEIHNPTSGSINTTNWQIRGEVSFNFPAMSIASRATWVIISFNPASAANADRLQAFKIHYGIQGNSSIVILGGYSGNLSNNFGKISLLQPDAPTQTTPPVIPAVVVDEVLYDDLAPWANADGSGNSLHRRGFAVNGNLAPNWIAVAPSPGSITAAVPKLVSTVRDAGDIRRPDLWNTLVVKFDNDVVLGASALTLRNDTTGGTNVALTGMGFSYNNVTFTATWDFSTLSQRLNAAFYTYTLNAAGISSFNSGHWFDGDNNNSPGGNFSAAQYVAIPGDANLDGDVDVSELIFPANVGDLSILKANLGMTAGATWSNGDFNGDGDVDVSQLDLSTLQNVGDLTILYANLGRNVRPPANLTFMTASGGSSEAGSSDEALQDSEVAVEILMKPIGNDRKWVSVSETEPVIPVPTKVVTDQADVKPIFPAVPVVPAVVELIKPVVGESPETLVAEVAEPDTSDLLMAEESIATLPQPALHSVEAIGYTCVWAGSQISDSGDDLEIASDQSTVVKLPSETRSKLIAKPVRVLPDFSQPNAEKRSPVRRGQAKTLVSLPTLSSDTKSVDNVIDKSFADLDRLEQSKPLSGTTAPEEVGTELDAVFAQIVWPANWGI